MNRQMNREHVFIPCRRTDMCSCAHAHSRHRRASGSVRRVRVRPITADYCSAHVTSSGNLPLALVKPRRTRLTLIHRLAPKWSQSHRPPPMLKWPTLQQVYILVQKWFWSISLFFPFVITLRGGGGFFITHLLKLY